MQSAALNAAIDHVAERVTSNKTSEPSALGMERLDEIWAELQTSLAPLLDIDVHLRDACIDFEDALVTLERAKGAQEVAAAVDDLNHHSEMLSALLSSPIPH